MATSRGKDLNRLRAHTLEHAGQVTDHAAGVSPAGVPEGQGVLVAGNPSVPQATAIAQLCEHLTATKTRYPGTDLTLRYEVKSHP